MSRILRQNRIVGVLAALIVVLSLVGYVLYMTDTVEVTFINGDGTVSTGRTLEGFAPWYQPDPVEKPRFTFVGWEDENGRLLWTDAIKPREDMTLTAKYMVSWETEEHIPYLPMADHGFVLPDEPLTRGEAAQMMYTLYEMPVKCTGHYANERENPDYFIAVGTLYTLKMYERHDRFEGDRAITRGELLEMWTAFHPAKRYTVTFADLSPLHPHYDAFVRAASLGWIDWGSDVAAEPDGIVTRGEAAAIMNRALGRQPAADAPTTSVGVFPDMKIDHKYYGDIVEALVPHKYVHRDGVEKRRNWEKRAQVAEGRVFVGTTHYYVGADGRIVRNDVVGNYIYDEDGRFTTGMPELDVLLEEVMVEIISPNMTKDQRLRAAFDWTVNAFTYLKSDYYARRSTGWGERAAYKMLSTKYGNCFSYASVFYELSRVLGEEPTLISGAVGIYGAPHGWVEFYVGEGRKQQRFVCDTELEMAVTKKTGRSPNLYMVTGYRLMSWMYFR